MPSTRALTLLIVNALMLGAACGGGGGGGGTGDAPPTPVAVTLATVGTGSGKVTSTPAGIDCGAACTAKLAGTVTLSAAADAGSRFVGWAGACKGLRNPCVVSPSAAASATASFSKGGSGLPAPNAGGIARPSGAAAHLKVLDWAGFRSAISYTFDDAFPSQVYGDNYGVIRATGIPVTYYVVPSQVGLHLDAWKQILADGNELGNHTLNHCRLGTDGLNTCLYGGTPAAGATAASQIDDTTAYIKGTLGASGVWTIASPYGDAGWGTPAQAAHMLVNRDVEYSGHNAEIPAGDLTKQFHLPSYLFGDEISGHQGHTVEAIDGRIDSVRTARAWAIFLFHSLSPVTTRDVSACCDVPATNVAASLDHLSSLGDVWGGTVVDVAAYWVGQVLLQQAPSATVDGVTTWTWALPDDFPPGKYVRVTVDGGTLAQGGQDLAWDPHGYYEVALDARELTLR